MTTLKEASIEVISSLPSNSSLEQIMYEINLTAQVLDGLNQEEEGKTISSLELLTRVKQWQQK